MRALVVYESIFGNTRSVAEAVAAGMSGDATVDVVAVGDAPTVIGDDVDLLVVGGPTHAFGMTRPSTRQDAARQGGGTALATGLREWLAALGGHSSRTVVTAFDTRIKKPRLPGSAARGALRRLRKLGYPVAAPATSFYVTGTAGPLLDGEIERAREWGRTLASTLAEGQPAS